MSMKHVSSGSFQAWRTPRLLADAFRVEYDLVLDVAADVDNTVCPCFFDGSEGADGLTQPWNVPFGGVWCNPPYADTAAWLDKAFAEVEAGNCMRAVLLVPAAVGVSWFARAVREAEVFLFDERIRFELPPMADLSPALQMQLFKATGVPKTSPGGGNALVVIETGGLVGVTGLRSTRTGRMIQDFTTGETYAE